MRLRQRFFALLLLALLLSACGVVSSPAVESATSTIVEATAVPSDTPEPTASLPEATAEPSAVTEPSVVPTEAATAASVVLAPTLANGEAPAVEPLHYSYQVVNSYLHDSAAYTQGLIYYQGKFYEGTGLYGQSSLRLVELETGNVLQELKLDPQYFGEGIVLVDDRIIQLTWQSNVGFVYDRESFTQLQTFTYPTEGWGLTYDGTRLIMSDGSATLYFRDPLTFDELGYVEVHDQYGPVAKLNELEYIDGAVYANIYQTDQIARIDPATGAVTAWIDLSGLLTPEEYTQGAEVLNGIAYDPDGQRLFVTGKRWPRLFEITLVQE